MRLLCLAALPRLSQKRQILRIRLSTPSLKSHFRELPPAQFALESARDLSGHVSRRIPATTLIMNNNDGDGDDGSEEEEMFYEKIIVIKVSNTCRG